MGVFYVRNPRNQRKYVISQIEYTEGYKAHEIY